MGWQLSLLVIMGGLVVLLASGMPVAFVFLLLNALGLYFWWGGSVGLEQLILSIFDSVTSFNLLPIALFILMGEVMFLSAVANNMMDAVDKWMGRVPGRLALLAIGGGTLFATLSGSSMASVAMLGSTLTPEMEKRGYDRVLSLGTIMGSGGLAMMIPPSGVAVVMGVIGEISIGKLLMAIVMPGFLLAALYAIYVIGRCLTQPNLAPVYDVIVPPLRERLEATIKYILPLGLIIFLVMGLIMLGMATPTEAAAAGTLGCFVLAAAYRRLNWGVIKKSFASTLEITGMIFMIIAGAQAFSQNLAYTGASAGLAELITTLSAHPLLILIGMQLIGLILGMFMNIIPILMITLPIFMPVVHALGFSDVWFGAIYMINMEIGAISPPFGLSLFVMRGVAPAGTTMGECYRAAIPFCLVDLIGMALVMAFPQIALWLPSLMLKAA